MLHTRTILAQGKRTYILAVIACLVSSCNIETADNVLLSNGEEMSFNVSDLSRASVATVIDRFAVYGDVIVMADNNTPTPVILFNNTEVVYEDGQWSYDGIQYWFSEREHSFVAISPVSVLTADAFPTYANSKLSFVYSIPAQDGHLSSTSDVADILISTHRRYYDPGKVSQSEIYFNFSHILSLINIAPAFYDNSLNSDAYIMFHRLEFSGVTTKARFDIEPAAMQTASQTDDRLVYVDGQEEGNFSIELATPVKVENNSKNVSLFDRNDAIIMLPQVFDVESESTLTLYYTINGDQTMKQVVLPLNNLKWETGSSHTYKFTIERTGVKFGDCEINPWNLMDGGEIAVD